jgi:hypothetical protein
MAASSQYTILRVLNYSVSTTEFRPILRPARWKT